MKKIIFFVMFFATTSYSYGYIDPGTTTTLIGGGIWPWLLALFSAIGVFVVKFVFKPVKSFIQKIWQKIKKS